MKTTLIIETVRVARLEKVVLEELALRRAGIQEAGCVDPEEARRGGLGAKARASFKYYVCF